jgi:hypothetical protein
MSTIRKSEKFNHTHTPGEVMQDVNLEDIPVSNVLMKSNIPSPNDTEISSGTSDYVRLYEQNKLSNGLLTEAEEERIINKKF